MVLAHRWTSLVLGLLLVFETTTGAVLLYHDDYFRATNAQFYRHTASAHPLTAQQALDIVRVAHPEFAAAWVSSDNGILAVGDPAYATAYAVDPGTGRINGFAHLQTGLFGWLANLHECALSCQGYPGYVPALATPVLILGVTCGGLLLALLGFLLLLLGITGVLTWWPGFRRLSHGFWVRTGRGRFARDRDLHNVIGVVAVPFLLMWGLTGVSFEFPQVRDAWLTVTGGHAESADCYSFTPEPPLAHRLGPDAAVIAALGQVTGQVRYLVLPQPDADYYTLSVATGSQPYGHRAFFGGDVTVYVDGHDPDHVSVVDSPGDRPASNTLYDRILEPSHFGWLVDGWWRLVWLIFGLTPLALAVTGLSTWLVRRGARRRRRATG